MTVARTVVVTGGGKGIGRAVVARFAATASRAIITSVDFTMASASSPRRSFSSSTASRVMMAVSD